MRSREFGELLRKLRKEAGKTMGDVARHLAVSVPYLSDVERGYRAPMSADRIRRAAAFLGVNPSALEIAAGRCRGAYELPGEGRALHHQAAVSLARGWAELSDEQLKGIMKILEKVEG